MCIMIIIFRTFSVYNLVIEGWQKNESVFPIFEYKNRLLSRLSNPSVDQIYDNEQFFRKSNVKLPPQIVYHDEFFVTPTFIESTTQWENGVQLCPASYIWLKAGHVGIWLLLLTCKQREGKQNVTTMQQTLMITRPLSVLLIPGGFYCLFYIILDKVARYGRCDECISSVVWSQNSWR
jgi:hypothetical protein